MKNLVCCFLMLFISFILAQELTLEDLYHPEQKVSYSGTVPYLDWLDETHYLEWKHNAAIDKPQWYKVNVENGDSVPFYDISKIINAFSLLPGINAKDAEAIAFSSYSFSDDKTAVIIHEFNDLFYYSLEKNIALRLTYSAEEESVAHFSPNAEFVSFIQNNDLYIVDIATQKVRSLTTGGSKQIFNGHLDWVYQEEIYGRGNFKGYWWSPDSQKIVYLQLDETEVKTFTVVDHTPYRLDLEVTSYPKAGDPNPKVRIGVIDAKGGKTKWLDTFRYETSDFLIVNVSWHPNSQEVCYQLQNREQTWLDLNFANAKSGKSRTLFRETSPAWVNVNGSPQWLNDDEFLWLSERSGFKHIYRFNTKGALVKQITTGEWEIKNFHGYNPSNQNIYFSANKDSFIANHTYKTSLQEENVVVKISTQQGNHRSSFNSSCSFYVDYWSNISTPTQVSLHQENGNKVRNIVENTTTEMDQYTLGATEFHQVKTRDDFTMEAMMIKPPDFDPNKKYPVFCYTYSGPHASSVENSWQGTQYLWHQLLAQKGYIIWICDNRTASAKGVKYTWQAYKNFGALELQDLEDGLNWLKEKPFVDKDRIGIWGWSYGGYMTCYALTNSKSFKIGIAGAPVTDWRNYDTVYTERYMATPQNNIDGYIKSSPVHNADQLHGNLLIIHGSMDDNVHLQNTIQFSYALQKANKQFSMMIYPRSRHGISNSWQRYHLRKLMTDFILNNL